MSAWTRTIPWRVRPCPKLVRQKECWWDRLPICTPVRVPMIVCCRSDDVSFSSRFFFISGTPFMNTLFAPLPGQVYGWFRSSIGVEQTGQLCKSWWFCWKRVLDKPYWLLKSFVWIRLWAWDIRLRARRDSSHKSLPGQLVYCLFMPNKQVFCTCKGWCPENHG